MASHLLMMTSARLLAGLALIAVLTCCGVPDSTNGPRATGAAEPDVGTQAADDRPARKLLHRRRLSRHRCLRPAHSRPRVQVTAPRPAPSPIQPALKTTALVQHPLRDLSPEAAEYLATRSGPIGVAVVVPSYGHVYTSNGGELFPLASVAKVAIMVTVLDRAIREGRDLTTQELALLEPMITISDNDAATALWDDVGGAEAVETYLGSLGLTTIRPNAQGYWGASRASASDVALLLTQLVEGEMLDEPNRRLAIELMVQVDPAQRWGVTAVSPDQSLPGSVAGIKDGWYPTECGWWVNSAGFVIQGNEQPAYTIVVLTREQPSLGEGIAAIEELTRYIHPALHERMPRLRPLGRAPDAVTGTEAGAEASRLPEGSGAAAQLAIGEPAIAAPAIATRCGEE